MKVLGNLVARIGHQRESIDFEVEESTVDEAIKEIDQARQVYRKQIIEGRKSSVGHFLCSFRRHCLRVSRTGRGVIPVTLTSFILRLKFP